MAWRTGGGSSRLELTFGNPGLLQAELVASAGSLALEALELPDLSSLPMARISRETVAVARLN